MNHFQANVAVNDALIAAINNPKLTSLDTITATTTVGDIVGYGQITSFSTRQNNSYTDGIFQCAIGISDDYQTLLTELFSISNAITNSFKNMACNNGLTIVLYGDIQISPFESLVNEGNRTAVNYFRCVMEFSLAIKFK
jgi:pyoverdine/dityrosine biosynthesis protein Dit1